MSAARHRALALRRTGDLAGARQILTDIVESAHPPPYGPDHPEVLDTAHLLARLHREAGDLSAARRVLEEALAAGERLRSEADPLLLALVFELATVADELGNRHEARRNFHRIVTAGPVTLGVDHSSVRAARAYLNEAGLADASPGMPGPFLAEQQIPGRLGAGTGAAPSSDGRLAQTPAPAKAAPEIPPAPLEAPPPLPETKLVPPGSSPDLAGHATSQRSAVGPAPDGHGGRRRPRPDQPRGPRPRYGAFGARPAPGAPASDPAPGPPLVPDDAAIGLLPAAHPAREPQRRGRNWTAVAAVLAAVGVAAVAVVGTGVVVFLRSGPAAAPLSDNPRESAAGTPSGAPTAPPPTELSLRDDSTSVTLSWSDPSGGAVPFVIAAGRAGQQLGMRGRVEPGRTSYTINGLSAEVDYCFTVLAVYSTEMFTTSGQVCTNRER